MSVLIFVLKRYKFTRVISIGLAYYKIMYRSTVHSAQAQQRNSSNSSNPTTTRFCYFFFFPTAKILRFGAVPAEPGRTVACSSCARNPYRSPRWRIRLSSRLV